MTAGRPSTGVLFGAAGPLPVGLTVGGVSSGPAGRGRGRGIPAVEASDTGAAVGLPTAGTGRAVPSFGAIVFGRPSTAVVFPPGAAVGRFEGAGLAEDAAALRTVIPEAPNAEKSMAAEATKFMPSGIAAPAG